MAVTTLAVAGLAVSAASAVKSADTQRKALHAQQDAINGSATSTETLAAGTAEQAKQNAIMSRQLEQQLTPEVTALRTASNQGLLNYIGQPQDPNVSSLSSRIASEGGMPLDTPLLKESIAKARADLALGGRLSTDVQNSATRGAAARAGQTGNLSLGRDLTARDLGITSQNLEQQRLMNGSKLGGQELDMASNNSSNLLNSLTALRQVSNDRYNQLLGAAQYGNSIAPPMVGMDPSAVSNLAIARQNASNQLSANQANNSTNNFNAYANLAGQGLAIYKQYQANQPPPVVETPAQTNIVNQSLF